MTSRFDQWLWRVARLHTALHGWTRRTTGIHLKGLGFLLRHLRGDHVLDACGHRWLLDHRIGGTFAPLMRGSFTEPETHAFLQYVAAQLDRPFAFVDVGANIGEMMVTMAAHPNCTNAVGFEPHPVCAAACRRNLEINRLSAEVREQLVGDGTAQPYVIDEKESPLSGIRHDVRDAPLTRTVRLDDLPGLMPEPCILLIDVEGAELTVMQGAADTIRAARPLIIFEYHEGTRRNFSLDEVHATIGEGYELFRLRTDGWLDRELGETWNCVAVHADSVFRAIAERRLSPG
jgi:FkbM family methyltransferase